MHFHKDTIVHSFIFEEVTRQEEKHRGHDKSLLWHIVMASSRHVTSILSQVLYNKRRKKTNKQVKKSDKSIWYWNFTDYGALRSPPRRSPQFTAVTTSWVKERVGTPNVHDRDDNTGKTRTRKHTHMHPGAVAVIEVTFFLCLFVVCFCVDSYCWHGDKMNKVPGRRKKKAFWPCTLTTRDYVQCKDVFAKKIQIKVKVSRQKRKESNNTVNTQEGEEGEQEEEEEEGQETHHNPKRPTTVKLGNHGNKKIKHNRRWKTINIKLLVTDAQQHLVVTGHLTVASELE